jgi:hypothetical protein
MLQVIFPSDNKILSYLCFSKPCAKINAHKYQEVKNIDLNQKLLEKPNKCNRTELVLVSRALILILAA